MQTTTLSHPGLWKAARVLAALLLAGAIITVLFLAFTFGLAFIADGQIISDGSGLMRLFLHANEAGERPIDAPLFGYAGMPALAGAGAFFLYCCVLVSFLRKCKKKGAFFPGGRGYLIALFVLSCVSTVLPQVLSGLFAANVAQSGYFALESPSIIPGCAVIVLTAAAGILYLKRASEQNKEGESEV